MFIKAIYNVGLIIELPCMLVAHRRMLTWSKGSRTMPLVRKFDYIYCRGIDFIRSLNRYTIREGTYYFLTILMFKNTHGIAPTYLSDRVVMNFDVNGYDTRGSDMD